MAKSLIILSHKSCGSSVLLRMLAAAPGVRAVAHTRHYQNESLYWTKAASILGLPQLSMQASEVPLRRAKAKRDLLELLRANAPLFAPPSDDESLVFDGWRALCEAHAPVFVEKSPHHLYQQSCLDLMREAVRRIPHIDFHFVGLVRNPMDVVYSQWRRWRLPPERLQEEWLIAYRNLIAFQAQMVGRVTLVRYEEMVRSAEAIKPILEFCATRFDGAWREPLHDRSVAKWRRDAAFGFRLKDEVLDLAYELGYCSSELPERGPSRGTWPLIRETARIGHGLGAPVRSAKKLAARVLRRKPLRSDEASTGLPKASRASSSMQTLGNGR